MTTGVFTKTRHLRQLIKLSEYSEKYINCIKSIYNKENKSSYLNCMTECRYIIRCMNIQTISVYMLSILNNLTISIVMTSCQIICEVILIVYIIGNI